MSWPARSSSAAAERGCALAMPDDAEEVPGQGIRGTVGGHQVAVGKAAWAGSTRRAPRGPRRRAAARGSTAR